MLLFSLAYSPVNQYIMKVVSLCSFVMIGAEAE